MIKKTFVVVGKKYAEAYSDAVDMWKQFVMTEFDADKPNSWPSPIATHYAATGSKGAAWVFQFEDDVENVQPGWS